MADYVIFNHPDGLTYVARFDDDETTWRWPAEQGGWQRRQACPEETLDDCEELPPRLAALALRLSGVPE